MDAQELFAFLPGLRSRCFDVPASCSEQMQPLLHASRCWETTRLHFRWNHTNHLAGGDPVKIIARPNAVAVGDGFGYRQLQLTGDFRHILTIARIKSLSKTTVKQ